MMDEQARRLKDEQLQRAVREQHQARRADEPDEADQHERRAEKADYLREKLTERIRSELPEE
jgi:hypothetical protein